MNLYINYFLITVDSLLQVLFIFSKKYNLFLQVKRQQNESAYLAQQKKIELKERRRNPEH